MSSTQQLTDLLEQDPAAAEFLNSGIFTTENRFVSSVDLIASAAKSSGVVQYPDGALGLSDPTSQRDGRDLNPRSGVMPGEAVPTPEDLQLWNDIDAGKPVLDLAGELQAMTPAPSSSHAPELIIGGDNRYRITNTLQYSSNAIGYLSTGLGQCTAEFYGNNVIVTAAHCLMLNGVWANGNWYVDRGRNGTSLSYSRCYGQTGFVLGGWTYNQILANDLGAVRVDCSIPGTYGNGILPLVSLPACPYNECTQSGWVNGYPGEKGGQQWEGYGVLTLSVTQPSAVIYYVDTSAGQSGGLVSMPCGAYGWGECQIGVHTQGVTETGFFYSSTVNLAHKFQSTDIVALAGFRGY